MESPHSQRLEVEGNRLRLALTAIGGVIGGFFGMPGLGATLGGIAGGLLFPGPDVKQEGPRLSDLKVTSSAYGNPIPRLYGRYRAAGNIIWGLPIRETSHEEEEGGKGGPTVTTTTYTYSATFAIAWCAGPIADVTRIWADEKLIYDKTGSNQVVSIEGLNFVTYLGTEDQSVDATIESNIGVGKTPAHRGLAYTVFNELQLAEFGNRIPNLTAEIANTFAQAYPYDYTPGSLSFIVKDPYLPLCYGINGNEFYIYNCASQVMEMTSTLTNSISTFGKVATDGDGLFLWVQSGQDCCMAHINTDTGAIDLISGGFYQVLTTAYDVILSREYVYGTWWNSGYLIQFDRLTLLNAVVYDASDLIPGATLRNGCVAPDGALWLTAVNGPSGANPTYVVKFDPINHTFLSWDISESVGDLNAATGISYDTKTDCLIIICVLNTIKWDPESESVTGTVSAGSSKALCIQKQGPVNGRIWVYSGYAAELIDTESMTVVSTFNSSSDYKIGSVLGQYIYDRRTNSIVACGTSNVYQLYLDRGAGDGTTLGNIVSDLSKLGQLKVTDFDVSELTDTVIGYAVPSRMAIRSAIEPLMLAYRFDATLSDGKIYFIKRGKPSTKTIPLADLSAREYGTDVPEPLERVRVQEQELPCQVDVCYLSDAKQYEPCTQHSRRLTVSSKDAVKVDCPIVLTDTEAARIAEIMLYCSWTGRTSAKLSVSRKYLELIPTDVIEVEL